MKNLVISNGSLLKALQFARLIAKQTGGRIATMSDIALNRTKTEPDSNVAWNSWLIPATMLFFGEYNGKKLMVVAHHFGPLTTDGRLLEWSGSGEKDPGSTREKYGFPGCPKITQKEFNSLVGGEYGEVKVIDFEEYCLLHKKNLGDSHITIDAAVKDPLLEALLSNDFESYKEFLETCFKLSEKNAVKKRKDAGAAEKIIELGLRDRYGWNMFSDHKEDSFPEQPTAFLFTFGRPSFWGNHDLSVSTEFRVTMDLNYSRVMVFNDENEDAIELKYNPNLHWKQCLVPTEEEFNEPFFSLVGEEELFVEYPKSKDGAWMDTGERMFPILELKKIGQPTTFTTHDCLFFLKYHIDEVKKLAPEGANSYSIIGDVEGRDTVKVPIQFYYAVPITEKRILKSEEVMGNLDLLLEINEVLIPV